MTILVFFVEYIIGTLAVSAANHNRKSTDGDPVDRVIALVIVVTWYSMLMVSLLTPADMPETVQLVGAFLIPLGFLIAAEAVRENPFATLVARPPGYLVTTGPYAYVKHPMYLGVLIYMLGSPLLLGSWVGLMFWPVMLVIYLVRIWNEERLLREWEIAL